MDVQPGRSEIDPVLGIHLLREGLRGPRSRGAEAGSGVTVPALVDVPSGKVATNASTRDPGLVRFDAVYHNHFRCNRNKLAEMPL